MADKQHSALTSVHRLCHVSNTDPGAVGAYHGWVDTSSTPFILKVRNAGDTGWDVVGATPIFTAIASQAEAEAGTNNTKGMTPLRVAQAIAALAPTGGGGGASAVADLTDVDLTGLADGFILVYDNASSTWKVQAKPATPAFTAIASQAEAEAGTNNTKGMTPLRVAQAIAALVSGGASNLDGLSDVVITSPTTDEVLKYNGTNWVNGAAPSGGSASPFSKLTWGSTFDTYGGTTYTLTDSNHTISKNNNDSTWRTGAYDLTAPISDEGVLRHVVGFTPDASSAGGHGLIGFGLAHNPASMVNGIAYMDFEYFVDLESTTASNIFANGSNVGTSFACNIGDVIEFKVIKNSQGTRAVSLWVNGSRVYKFATAPTMNLYPTCGLYHQSRSFNAQIATFIP